MPADIAKNLSRDEIRDLVEYMSTLKTAKEDGAHGEEK
jgi:cytochrome c553